MTTMIVSMMKAIERFGTSPYTKPAGPAMGAVEVRPAVHDGGGGGGGGATGATGCCGACCHDCGGGGGGRCPGAAGVPAAPAATTAVDRLEGPDRARPVHPLAASLPVSLGASRCAASRPPHRWSLDSIANGGGATRARRHPPMCDISTRGRSDGRLGTDLRVPIGPALPGRPDDAAPASTSSTPARSGPLRSCARTPNRHR